jgi:hypothetical protein
MASDDDLLARAARDPEAFGAFYERHERLVLGWFARRTGVGELAVDLAFRHTRRHLRESV